MHQRISKKIIIYLFLFSIFTTVNNKSLNTKNFSSINSIKITGINIKELEDIEKDIDYLNYKNIFFLNKLEIKKNIYSNEIIEKISIFKNYPSSLEINIEKTKFLAILNKNGENLFIGANGKLIKSDNYEIISHLPFVFGKVNSYEFLEFKEIIDNSGFDFESIKNLYFYPSKRWDLETKKGLLIKLPKNKLKEKLNFLTILLKKDEFQNKKIIDLRQKNQVVVNGK